MSTLNIYFRQDLGMRKGKIAAQIAHAACAQMLNAMDDHGDFRLLPRADYASLEALIATQGVCIHPVADEAALRQALTAPEKSAIIIDRGLTEFGGVPTLTAAAQGVFEPSPLKAVPMSRADLIARQWFVFSKERPLPKEHVARMAAIGCLKMMHYLIKPPIGAAKHAALPLYDPALRGWLTAGFGKIGMGIKTDADLMALQEALMAIEVPSILMELDGSKLLVIGPQFPETVSTIMGRESDIYTQGVLSLL
jgi:peptidyl-tRNA hydrolase